MNNTATPNTRSNSSSSVHRKSWGNNENECSRGVTQGKGKKERDRRAPSLRCNSNTVLRRLFFISRLTREKPFYIAFFELKLSMSLQIRRFLYRLDLATIYKRVKRCTTYLQSTQDFFCAQQFIVTHTIQKPFCTSWTRCTFLTSYLDKMYNTNIVHDKIKFDKVQKKSTDRSQCPNFLPMSKLLRLDWYPVAIALDQYALLLLYLTDSHISSQSVQEPRCEREAHP